MPEPSIKELQLRAQAAARAAKVQRLPVRPGPSGGASSAAPRGDRLYAELHCLTHFSFQRGASSPQELVRRAWALGYTALAITDECSVAGVVRAWQALRECERAAASGSGWGDAADDELAHALAARAALGMHQPLTLLYGSEFRFAGQGTLVALARDLASWGDVCSFITRCRGAATKGDYRLPPLITALDAMQRCELLWAPCRTTWRQSFTINSIAENATPSSASGGFKRISGLLAELHADADDALWLAALQQQSASTGLPLLAAGDVHMHVRARKRLQDVMTAIRVGRPVQACGFALQPNAERHLRPLAQLADHCPPALLAATLAVAGRCHFSL